MVAKSIAARGLTRRGALRLGAAGAAGSVLAACQPAAPAASTAAPAAQAVANPEWDKVLAAAKKEGKVVVAGAPGETYRKIVPVFQKAYPDISLEWTGVAGADFAPKIIAERGAGQYLWDAHVGGPGTMYLQLKPAKVLAPLKETLILPEILDSSKWLNGFDAGWMDVDGSFTYAFMAWPGTEIYVNRDKYTVAQISKFDQLIEPAWKGTLAMDDPRRAGAGIGTLVRLLINKGEDWVAKLLQNGVVISGEERQLADWLVRGTYGLGGGVTPAFEDQYLKLGLGKNLKALEAESPYGTPVRTGFGCIGFIDRAPRPNAAKVFINWLLSKDGQSAWADNTGFNSRRLDVPTPATSLKYDPNNKYNLSDGEKFASFRARASELAKKYLV